MYNAAIIIFKRCTLPKLLNFFAKPDIRQIVEAGSDDNKTRVHILECPVLGNAADNRKLAKTLKSLCLERDIRFFIGKNTEYYFESGLEYLENSLERGNTEEIKGIKDLAALIKLSDIKNKSLLKRNMCFAGDTHSYRYISTMSEEAAGVFIYEYDNMKSGYKKEVYEQLMAEKGISAVFTKDLGRAISQCDIILADEAAELDAYKAELTEKVLIGSNAVSGCFEKVSRVLLWHESLAGLPEDNILISLNDEMLGILRHFYREKGLISFLMKFPYIYMY